MLFTFAVDDTQPSGVSGSPLVEPMICGCIPKEEKGGSNVPGTGSNAYADIVFICCLIAGGLRVCYIVSTDLK